MALSSPMRRCTPSPRIIASVPKWPQSTAPVRHTEGDGPTPINVALFTTVASVESQINPNYVAQGEPYGPQGFAYFVGVYFAPSINAAGGVHIPALSPIPRPVNLQVFNIGYGTDPNDVTKVVNVTTTGLVQQQYGYFPIVRKQHHSRIAVADRMEADGDSA